MQKFTKLTQFHNTQFLIIKLIASKSIMINLMCKFYKKMFNWEKSVVCRILQCISVKIFSLCSVKPYIVYLVNRK